MVLFYCLLISLVVGFQLALVAGAPWGKFTQGGLEEGPLPLSARLVAAGSVAVLIGMTLAILSADGSWPHWPIWTFWVALSAHALTMAANWLSPSVPERAVWGPITTGLFLAACAIIWT